VFLDNQPNGAARRSDGGLAIFYDNAWPNERIPLNVHIAKPGAIISEKEVS